MGGFYVISVRGRSCAECCSTVGQHVSLGLTKAKVCITKDDYTARQGGLRTGGRSSGFPRAGAKQTGDVGKPEGPSLPTYTSTFTKAILQEEWPWAGSAAVN